MHVKNNFSSMKLTKSKLRTQLYYDHLQNVMILTSSAISELQKFSNKKQHEISH